MKEQIKIAIFGLSLNVLDNIKQKLSAMYEESFEVVWVNIGEPQLDILLVNEMFFGSPTIQNIVNSRNVPYLRMVAQSDKSGSIEGDTMYLPFVVTDQIRSWFKARYLKMPVEQVSKKSDRQVFNHAIRDLKKVIDELFNERNGNIQVFDHTGNIGVINTRTEQVWLESDYKVKGIEESLNYTYATMHMTQSVSAVQGIDLRTWLWNALWYSSHMNKDISSHTFYKLAYWPQPESKMDRATILKIAACFEKGANIQQIEQKTGIAKNQLIKFVSVALYTNALKQINEEEAKYVASEPKDTQGIFKGFFGKLRKKLGL